MSEWLMYFQHAKDYVRARTLIAAVLAASLAAIGCSDLTGPNATRSTQSIDETTRTSEAEGAPADTPGGRNADVRVAHLSPDAPAVDIYVGTEPGPSTPTIGGLTYPNFAPDEAGDYVELSPGSYDIAVTPQGADTPQVIDVDGLELRPNTDYTILAVGELSPEGDEPGIQAVPLVDNADEETTLPPRDKALVRFVHASPDAGTVDIAVDGTTVLSDVSFATASAYLEVAPGSRTVEIIKGGRTVLTVQPDLEAGTKVTAYVIGNATAEDGDAQLSAVTSLEATNPAGTGELSGDRDEVEDEAEQD